AVRSPFVHKPTAVGRPLSRVEIKIDQTGSGPGEILARGPGVAERYWGGQPAATSEDGWFRTGDRGYLDREGQLHITSPVRQPITSADGQEIDPAEIEEALSSRPAILEACVFSKKSQSAGGPCAAIVASTLARSKPDLKERIGLEVNEALAPLPEHKRLSDYQIWECELPRTATGKLRRGEIATAYGGKRKTRAAETAGPDDLVWDSQASAISKIIAEVMDAEILRAISPSGSHVFAPNLRLVN